MNAIIGKSFSQLRKAEQDAFLNPKMAEIFGEGGFPEDFLQSLKEIGR